MATQAARNSSSSGGACVREGMSKTMNQSYNKSKATSIAIKSQQHNITCQVKQHCLQ